MSLLEDCRGYFASQLRRSSFGCEGWKATKPRKDRIKWIPACAGMTNNETRITRYELQATNEEQRAVSR
ncbi:MAG: hypothetical protein JW715_02945 [Sedimentisphaerales bacterium]|nr:hypothetical protein [Sedimentisphaerales bacterium]